MIRVAPLKITRQKNQTVIFNKKKTQKKKVLKNRVPMSPCLAYELVATVK